MGVISTGVQEAKVIVRLSVTMFKYGGNARTHPEVFEYLLTQPHRVVRP